MEESKNTNYNSIDLAKFIAAVAIIVLHTAPFSDVSKYLNVITRDYIVILAVPFFFIASAFLFFKKANSETDNSRIKHFSKRIVVMYLIWSAVYFIFILYKWIALKEFTKYSIPIYIRDFFFVGSYSTIWFLPALLVGVIIVYFLKKKFTINQILAISFVVYIFTLLGSSYFGVTTKIPFLKTIYDSYFYVFDTVKNGVLFAFPYAAIGAKIAETDYKTIKLSKSIISFIISMILMLIEVVLQLKFKLNTNGVDTILFLIPSSYFMFVSLLNINIKGNVAVYKKLRNCSMLMFLSQRIFLTIYPFVFPKIGLSYVVNNSILYFSAILISTLLFSMIIIMLSNKFKILKKLY